MTQSGSIRHRKVASALLLVYDSWWLPSILRRRLRPISLRDGQHRPHGAVERVLDPGGLVDDQHGHAAVAAYVLLVPGKDTTRLPLANSSRKALSATTPMGL